MLEHFKFQRLGIGFDTVLGSDTLDITVVPQRPLIPSIPPET